MNRILTSALSRLTPPLKELAMRRLSSPKQKEFLISLAKALGKGYSVKSRSLTNFVPEYVASTKSSSEVIQDLAKLGWSVYINQGSETMLDKRGTFPIVLKTDVDTKQTVIRSTGYDTRRFTSQDLENWGEAFGTDLVSHSKTVMYGYLPLAEFLAAVKKLGGARENNSIYLKKEGLWSMYRKTNDQCTFTLSPDELSTGVFKTIPQAPVELDTSELRVWNSLSTTLHPSLRPGKPLFTVKYGNKFWIDKENMAFSDYQKLHVIPMNGLAVLDHLMRNSEPA